jgi:hypothetical protein
MWTFVAASTLVALITPAFATASSNSAKVAARATILGKDNAPLNRYDYVIIGAGASGLTVADRLTENPTGKHFSRDFCRFPSHITLLLSSSIKL